MEPLGTNVFFLAEKPQRPDRNFRQVTMDSGGAVYDLDAEPPSSPLRSRVATSQPTARNCAWRRISPCGRNTEIYLRLPPLDARIPKLAEQITVDPQQL